MLGPLVYLYVGTSDVEGDLRFYREGLGAQLVWRFRAMGTEVAAIRLGPGPLVLLADHRPAGTVIPIWKCDDLDAAEAQLADAGWESGVRVEVPDGPCVITKDGSGNEVALMDQVRPNALEGAWREGSHGAVRE